jgi:hypothetical protein
MGFMRWLAEHFEFLKHFVELLAFALGLPALVALNLGRSRDVWRGYLLLRRFHAGTLQEGHWRTLRTLTAIATHDQAWLKPVRLFRLTRIRIEHEIFAPRPEFRWPTAEQPTNKAATRKKAKKVHDKELKGWKEDMGRIYTGEHEIIRLDSPADINSEFAGIKRYFETLKTLRFENKDGRGHPAQFLCMVMIGTGFIAPIHLLTGLLVQFNQKWKTILWSFNVDASDPESGEDLSDLRQIQMFIYNCWLLWGPSIPICTCKKWDAAHLSMQYGFGDENNSIELIGERERFTIQIGRLYKLARAHLNAAKPMPMALPCGVKGRLQLSGSLESKDGTGGHNPRAPRESWGGKQDERPILFLSEIASGRATEGDAVESYRQFGLPQPEENDYQSKYYSAYLWIAFVKLGPDGKMPARSGKDGLQIWKNFVPFFEHGNLADPETCLFAKKQLATKAVNALANAVREWPNGSPPRFAYACAIDDSGCCQKLAFPDWAAAPTVRELMEAIIDAGVTANDPLFVPLRAQLTFDYFDAMPERPYAACDLPVHVAEHYRVMAARDEERNARNEA